MDNIISITLFLVKFSELPVSSFFRHLLLLATLTHFTPKPALVLSSLSISIDLFSSGVLSLGTVNIGVLDNTLLSGTVLCTVGYLVASSPVLTIDNQQCLWTLPNIASGVGVVESFLVTSSRKPLWLRNSIWYT